MKIVVNKCFGGFGLSREAYDYIGLEWDGFGYGAGSMVDVKAWRTSPDLVSCVEILGSRASGNHADLDIIEIPDDVDDWRIEDYDGVEWIAEGRTWK